MIVSIVSVITDIEVETLEKMTAGRKKKDLDSKDEVSLLSILKFHNLS